MPSFAARHISEHKSEDLFNLVADIESYPQFLPACRDAEILEKNQDYLIARLTLRYGLLRENFTSRVILDRRQGMIHTELDSNSVHNSALKKLNCAWSFMQKEEACHISCTLDFEFSRSLLARIFSPLLHHAAQRLMESFIRRADDLSMHNQASAR